MVVSTVLIVVVTAMITTIATTIRNGSIMKFPVGFPSRTSSALKLLRRDASPTDRRLGRNRLWRATPRLEQNREQNEHQRGTSRRHQPDRMPVVCHLQALVGSRGVRSARRVGGCISIDHRARDESTDEIAESVGHEVDHTLRSSTDLLAGSLISIDLAADEEEVVADAVKNDAEIQERHNRADCTHSKREIAERPRRHADEHDHLDTEPAESHRQQQHEKDLRHLAKSLNERRIWRLHFIQQWIGEGVVELERDAEQERTGHEDEEVSILQQGE